MLSRDRNTQRRDGELLVLPVKGGSTIYAGALVCVDANGLAVPGTTAAGLKSAGRAEEYVANDGADGAVTIRVRRGVFKWKNADADAVTQANVLGDCYVVDDETVAKTDGGSTRSKAGKVLAVESDGVWVETV